MYTTVYQKENRPPSLMVYTSRDGLNAAGQLSPTQEVAGVVGKDGGVRDGQLVAWNGGLRSCAELEPW